MHKPASGVGRVGAALEDAARGLVHFCGLQRAQPAEMHQSTEENERGLVAASAVFVAVLLGEVGTLFAGRLDGE